MSLLKTIGQTQDSFAAMVGVSRNTIANIVSGRSPLNRALWLRIYRATGVYYGAYLSGWDELVSGYGRPYTKATFEEWQRQEGADQEFIKYAGETLQAL